MDLSNNRNRCLEILDARLLGCPSHLAQQALFVHVDCPNHLAQQALFVDVDFSSLNMMFSELFRIMLDVIASNSSLGD